MFGLALGFALLRAQALETTHDIGKFPLQWKRWDIGFGNSPSILLINTRLLQQHSCMLS